MPKRPKPRQARPAGKLKAPSALAGQGPVVTFPVAPPPPPGPAPEAVARFEQAMAAFQRHAFSEAVEGFRALIAAFPREGAVADRARLYIGVCERAMAQQPAGPKTAEERLTAATAALNDGDLDRAGSLAKAVIDADPQQDLALYLLAAVAARQGRFDDALERLGKAIALSPEVTAQARHDEDFEPLHDLEEFWKLTEPPPAEARGAARRPSRRGRTNG
jgi:tetratricopeptide (TPR) repeat protein